MIARVTWGKIKEGKWDDFQRLWNAYAKEVAAVPGSRGRLLLGDSENKNAGYSISFWDSAQAFEAYAASGPLPKAMQDCFVGQYVTTVTDVRGADIARLLAGI